MTRLAEIGVPTHFVRRLNMREQLIREVEIIPLEVVVRNVAAGTLSQAARHRGRHAACRARSSNTTTRTTRSNDPMVSEEHITAFGWANTAGPRRHRRADAADQRLPDRPVPRRRHHAGRLQAGVRPAVGERGDAHRAGRRDQPGQLPAVGHARPTRRWTRTASAATSARSRRPIRRSRAGSGILPEEEIRGPQPQQPPQEAGEVSLPYFGWDCAGAASVSTRSGRRPASVNGRPPSVGT